MDVIFYLKLKHTHAHEHEEAGRGVRVTRTLKQSSQRFHKRILYKEEMKIINVSEACLIVSVCRFVCVTLVPDVV